MRQSRRNRKPGRPIKPDGRMAPVNTNIPVGLYDELCRMANQRGVSLSAVVREVLQRQFRAMNYSNE